MNGQHPTASRSADEVTAGVIGVGHMGRHHARVYTELPGVTLAGVHDASGERARAIAQEYSVPALDLDGLLEVADAVSVAVPTEYHYDTVARCLENDVHVLVEKPFVRKRERGAELASRARDRGLVLQVGHIERFNPAVRLLEEIVTDLDVVAVDVKRLGPPLDRENQDSVVMDLMVHDIDILLSLLDADVQTVAAMARDRRHAVAQFQLENDGVATLTASRLTQQKIRRLSVTALSCQVNVDFIEQSVEIHRRSLPEYVESDGDIRYRHESIVERPMVETGEPLREELEAFLKAVEAGSEPLVTAADALEVLKLAETIETLAGQSETTVKSI